MFCNAKSKQEHYETIRKFFDLYLQEVHTDKDIKLLHGVWSNKEISHSEILKNYHQNSHIYSSINPDSFNPPPLNNPNLSVSSFRPLSNSIQKPSSSKLK